MLQTTPIMDRSSRYCVIGAGPAGLLAARSLKHAGVLYDQIEKNDDVGGLWEINNDWSPMYDSAHFISSKTVSHIPGYPMPEEYPDYPNHRQILAYLKSFADHYGLRDGILLNTAVERVERDGDTWTVRLDNGQVRRYRGLFICNGNTWDPNLPDYPGEFTGESFHSVRYRSREVFRKKRVLVVGGGNSGCDIACDAALEADQAFISLRRGYHFIPKHVFGVPSDKFAGKFVMPRWLEKPLFELVLRVLVGDLRRFGLPRPDHGVLESHPIVNTQILHHLSHGDIAYRPDIERIDGQTVHFVDGSAEELDLIVYATGYLVTYPFMDRDHFTWLSKYPDLYLSALHREYDNVCVLGLHQTDGGAYEFFAMQADMMANFILDQERNPKRAARFSALKENDHPDLSDGISYVQSARHDTYVKTASFRRHCLKLFRKFGWTQYSLQMS